MRVVVLLSALALAACDAEEVPATPGVDITEPADGATVTGPDVTVRFDVTDFDLVGPELAARVAPPVAPVGPAWLGLLTATAAAHEAGGAPEGFVRVLLDGVAVVDVAGTSTLLADVAAGAHTVEVELLWPDGDAFYPPVRDEVAFTVDAP